MTVDEQLQAMARRAEEEQRPITVEEIVARASGQDGPRFLEPSRPTPVWRQRRHWFLVAAAAAVIVAVVAVGLVALDTDDDEPVRVVTDPPTTTSVPASEVFGGAIVFAADAGAGPALTDYVEYPRVEQRPEPMDIYVTPAGGPTRRLVSSGAHEQCPAFSPDGARLAYLSVPHKSSNPEPPLVATLVVVRLDGMLELSDPELVVPHPAPTGEVRRNIGYQCPQWSPDGRRLAYLARPVGATAVQEDVAELRVVTLDGQEQVIDAASPSFLRWGFAWSPSGDAIAFLRDDGVWAATLDGEGPSLLWQAAGTPTAVSWSSRGDLAVMVETDDGVVVHVVDADGGSEPLGSLRRDWDFSASWSPDGTRLAFVTSDRQIVLHDRDDGSTEVLPPPQVDGRTVGFDDVAWSPSGEQLRVLAHAVDTSRSSDDDAFLMERGLALLALSTDGTLIDVLTPWSWAFDWTTLDDVASYPSG